MDRVDPISIEPIEEREEDMSSLAAGFTTWICKQSTSAQRETAFSSEGPGGKRLKPSGLDEEAQKSPTVIIVDSLEQAPDALPAWEGATDYYPNSAIFVPCLFQLLSTLCVIID